MEIGLYVPARIDEVGYVLHAESLGYSAVWVTDTQMIWSDCFAVLALAAQQTRRIRLGAGTAVAGTRIAPVTAGAIATINRLAPGRVTLGLGTGNTAMRAMGQRPMPLAEFREYVRVVRGLLRGDVVDHTYRGRTAPIQLLKQDPADRTHQFVALEPRIPLYVSGFGPRTQALAGELGDGLMFAIPPRGTTVEAARRNAEAGAARAGRALAGEGFRYHAMVNLCMLDPGERLDSPRVVEQCGPAAMATVHYLDDELRETGGEPPGWFRPIREAYGRLLADVPLARRHLRVHDGHYTFLHPGEERLVTPDLIRATHLVGTADELVERLRELAAAGLDELAFLLGTPARYRFAEEFARRVLRRL
jgi:alkanesulfonate monooxygenase SsuD/methylene tetrahydromethanopterin reductase-like flavin-dependent oxidoreductase (luciferase family)